jgi:outer membrane receptor protein involved in Fe transport
MAIKKSFTLHSNAFKSIIFPIQLCCAITPLLIAQAVGAEESIENIDEVIVTASKRNQSLKDFSGSVSVIKGDSFNPGASISDLADQVPGLTVINNGPRAISSLTMRGLRMDEVTPNDLGGDGSTVVTYIDNIPLQGFFVPPANTMKDLQQIEVLRGPQGTLYGNASIGGLIRYVTAKPDLSKTSVNIDTSWSQTKESENTDYSTDLIVNAPLVDNVLGVRLLLSKENNAGFIDAQSLYGLQQDKANSDYTTSYIGEKSDINSDQTKQLRGSILWQPAEEFSLGANYSYQKINADDRQASNKAVTGSEYVASSNFLQPMEGILKLSSVDATYDLGWATLTASLNRYDYTTDTTADQTDFLLYNYGAGYYAEYEDFTAFTRSHADVTKDSGELRLVSPNDQPLRWLVGVFVSNDDLDVIVADRVPGFKNVFGEDRPDALDYIATQTEALHENSIYAEVAYDLLPNWEVAVGGRYFKYEDDLETCSLLFPTAEEYEGNNFPLACADNDDDNTGSLNKFSTKYKFNDSQNIYLTISEGYRRGGANLLPIEITHNRSYNPDTVVNYEVGTHSDFFDGKFEINGAVYVMDWEKIQIGAVIEGRGATVNAGTARAKGIELDTATELNQHWSLKLGYSFVKAELTETVLGIVGGDENANSGNRLPGSPEQEWNLGLNYEGTFGANPLHAGITYYYASDMTTSLNNTFVDYAHLDNYSRVNAHVNVTLRNWQLGVFINNMTNTKAVTGRRTATQYGELGQLDYIIRPRTLGVTLSYEF